MTSILSPTPPPVAEMLFGDRLPLAIAYHDSLATDGMIRGFLGPKEKDRLWERHLINSALISEVIPEGATVIDVGSGAGLPGIPLAIARPDVTVTLVEPLLKRSVYLGEVVELLGLNTVRVIRGRAEDKQILKTLGRADVVTSRAVAPLGKLARWSLPLVKKGGIMAALKGESAAEEIERDAQEIIKAKGSNPRIVELGMQLVCEPAAAVVIDREK